MDGTIHGTLLSTSEPLKIGNSQASTSSRLLMSLARFCCFGVDGFVLSVHSGSVEHASDLHAHVKLLRRHLLDKKELYQRRLHSLRALVLSLCFLCRDPVPLQGRPLHQLQADHLPAERRLRAVVPVV